MWCGVRVLGWKISRNICTFVSVVSCVCQRILKVFFFFLLSCYNALLSQFYGIDSGVWGLFCCTCMYVFLKVIDSSMKLFAWFKLTTVVGCWKHRLEITKCLLFFSLDLNARSVGTTAQNKYVFRGVQIKLRTNNHRTWMMLTIFSVFD